MSATGTMNTIKSQLDLSNLTMAANDVVVLHGQKYVLVDQREERGGDLNSVEETKERFDDGVSLAAASSSGPPGPSKMQLSELTHLTAGMVAAGSVSHSSGGKTKKKKKGGKSKEAPLAADGVSIGKFYNVVAGRPYPSFTRLDQTIRVVDTFYVSAFITSSTTVPAGAASYFTLNNFTSATAYENVFDQYKIVQIEVWLDLNGNQDAVQGELVTAVDNDDAVVPTTATSISDKQGALNGFGATGRYHRFRPHVAVAEFAGTFTSYGNMPSTWIDSSSGNVQHYGFKAVLGVAGAVVNYNMTVRAVIDFRAPGL